MLDFDVFIEEAKGLFESYTILDSDSVNNLSLKRCKGSFIAIAGKYFLNREYAGQNYQKDFDIVVLLDRSRRFVVPIVWLPQEKRPFGFEHIYNDNTCCLGLTHEIVSIWGDSQSAKDFFEKIVDIFFINLLSYREKKVCVTEERPHAETGICDYYKDILEMSLQQCNNALLYIFRKINKRELAKGHNPCPCGSGIILRKCHGIQINNFLNSLYSNNELQKAFMQDVSILIKG